MKLHIPTALGDHTIDIEAGASRDGEFEVLEVSVIRNGRARILPVDAASAYLDRNLPGWETKIMEALCL